MARQAYLTHAYLTYDKVGANVAGMGKLISDQLREAIRKADASRYRIGKETGVEQSALSRFVNGTRGLDLSSVDKLAAYLKLELVKAADMPKTK